MKLTLSNVKEIKRNSDSPLTKRVCNSRPLWYPKASK